MRPRRRANEKTHPYIGWLNIGYSILSFLGGVLGFVILYGVSMIPEVRHEGASFILQIAAQVLMIVIVIASLPGLIGGIGVL